MACRDPTKGEQSSAPVTRGTSQLGGLPVEERAAIGIEPLDPLAGHHHEPVDLIEALVVFGRLQF